VRVCFVPVAFFSFEAHLGTSQRHTGAKKVITFLEGAWKSKRSRVAT